jgi:hypothetical protein
MKSIFILQLSIGLTFGMINSASAQSGAKPKPAAEPLKLKFCHLPSDSSSSSKIVLTAAQEWVDLLPLQVVCNDGQKYTLSQFQVTMITMKPLQTKDYGLANGGFPILARKALDQMKQGDTIFLKEVSGKDAKGNETKLPNLVLSITEPTAAPATEGDQK